VPKLDRLMIRAESLDDLVSDLGLQFERQQLGRDQ